MAIDQTIINEAIEKAAAAPKDSTSAQQRVIQHSLRDLLAVSDRADDDQAGNRRKLPIRLAKFRPGGAV